MEASSQLECLAGVKTIPWFGERLAASSLPPLRSSAIQVLQVNVGKRCNMSCSHCHVEAGPQRREQMSRQVLQRCLDISRLPSVTTIDVTGGAPEMNPHLSWFITQAAALAKRLMVRTNLTILLEKPYDRFVAEYAANRVELVASLPCYLAANTAKLRGEGAFERSITALRMLNQTGYGLPGTGLVLNLVHNPAGAWLPGAREELEDDYREHLRQEHGVEFSSLFVLTNCPVGRFLDKLVADNNLSSYMTALSEAFNPRAAEQVMCRTTLSVAWDGTLYDCDFNQMLQLPVDHGAPSSVEQFDVQRLAQREITVHNHCYACTAGAGSSCQGTLLRA